MQIRGQEAVNLHLVENAQNRHVRDASYDLSVEMVIVNGQSQTLPFTLKPQHMCTIVSKERVCIKEGFVAFAQPKTDLCQRGLLALSTGIIDLGYNGKLSTTAINFSQGSIELRSDDAFLRVTFHQVKPNTGLPPIETTAVSDINYISKKLDDSKLYPQTFLDIPKHLRDFSHELFKDVLSLVGSRFQWYVAVIALGFALVLGAGGIMLNSANKQDNKKSVDEIRDLVMQQLSNTNVVAQNNDLLRQYDAAISNIQAGLHTYSLANDANRTNWEEIKLEVQILESNQPGKEAQFK
jgi:deoxycytidine triphosphate deaminase